jgi:hypothetical protein
MMMDPASALKREVHQLIDQQINTLKQKSRLDPTQLGDYKARSKRIQTLYGELDRLGRAKVKFELARAS